MASFSPKTNLNFESLENRQVEERLSAATNETVDGAKSTRTGLKSNCYFPQMTPIAAVKPAESSVRIRELCGQKKRAVAGALGIDGVENQPPTSARASAASAVLR